jgi:protein TonB
MKDIHIGLLASIALHLCLLASLLLFAHSMDNGLSKVIPVDLRFLNDESETAQEPRGARAIERGTARLQGFIEPSGGGPRGRQKGPQKEEGLHPIEGQIPESLVNEGAPSAGRAAGPEGETVAVQVKTPSAGVPPHNGVFQPHPGSGGGRNETKHLLGAASKADGLNGGGTLQGGKDFSAIRDAIMRNIRYPERARKMGFEGRVLLSFVVMEDGSTARIRVVQGSGFGLLDEDAKRAVAKTRIVRGVPGSTPVLLPVVYSLGQGTAAP